jgi:stalled ribosome rescue protein Dom34
MSLIAVWVDHKQANVFKFTTDGIKKEELHGSFPNHHTHEKSNMEEQRHEEQVFKQLMPKLNDAEEILLLGPGMAKTHLKKYLENHSSVLGKKIVGCETTDHPTEPQLLSFASKFFNSEHLK